jgi:hypothetical protein
MGMDVGGNERRRLSFRAAAELAKLPENRVPERSDWAKISASWTKRIDELERLRAG